MKRRIALAAACAAALLLMSAARAKDLGLKPLAKIRSYADAEQAPEWFTTTPAKAIPRAVWKSREPCPSTM